MTSRSGRGLDAADERRVEPAGPDPVKPNGRGVRPQVHGHVRIGTFQCLQQLIETLAKPAAAAEVQGDRRLALSDHRRASALDRGEDRARLRQEPLSRRSQAHDSGRSLEEALPELAFEAGDLPAHGRLTDAQGLGGHAEAQRLRHREEALDLPDLHLQSLSLRPIAGQAASYSSVSVSGSSEPARRMSTRRISAFGTLLEAEREAALGLDAVQVAATV